MTAQKWFSTHIVNTDQQEIIGFREYIQAEFDQSHPLLGCLVFIMNNFAYQNDTETPQ